MLEYFMSVKVSWVFTELAKRRAWSFPVGRVPCITTSTEDCLVLSQTDENNGINDGGLSETLPVTNGKVNAGKLGRAVKSLGYAF